MASRRLALDGGLCLSTRPALDEVGLEEGGLVEGGLEERLVSRRLGFEEVVKISFWEPLSARIRPNPKLLTLVPVYDIGVSEVGIRR